LHEVLNDRRLSAQRVGDGNRCPIFDICAQDCRTLTDGRCGVDPLYRRNACAHADLPRCAPALEERP
jgi:hypothetical protein